MPSRARSIQNIFDRKFVAHLFDEMSKTYGLVNFIASFGFCERWRRQCVKNVKIKPDDFVVDYMTGMGEIFELIRKQGPRSASLVGLDFSPVMCAKAKAQLDRSKLEGRILEEDALASSLESDSVDVVTAAFGLKTFSMEQTEQFSKELFRVLKPGAKFSLIEISVPKFSLLKIPYMLYLKVFIPMIGALFMGNSDNYRMLGVYTELFESCEKVAPLFRSAGLKVEVKIYFFGCMSALVGFKPLIESHK